jgi:hypothetical protein
LVNVQINLTAALVQAPNLQSLLILGTSDVIDTVTRMREYDNLSDIATDFGTNSEEYQAAKLWFGQKPQPTTVLIGRWVQTNSAGQLLCGPVPAGDELIGPWNAINNGSLTIYIDGVGPEAVGNLDFTGAGNMNAVAQIIESGFPGGSATCDWDALNTRFIITSVTTGAASSISALTAGGTGTDISAMMSGRANSAGVIIAPGLAAQTALATVVLFDNLFSSQWYGLAFAYADLSAADSVAVASYIEAATNEHFYEATSADPLCKSAGSTTDLLYLLKQLNLTRTFAQYSSQTPYAGISALGRILTTDWTANNSTITLMYKNEPLVIPELLTATEMDAVLAKNGNVFVQYNNDTAIIQPGITPSGQYADTVIGCDWFKDSIQTAVFNLLYGTKKVPQTDAGNHQIATQIEASCSAAVNNGLLAPGVWNAGGFGQLQQGDYLPKGYYVYAPPISQQSTGDRAARKSVPFQVAGKLAGAVQTVNVAVDINS